MAETASKIPAYLNELCLQKALENSFQRNDIKLQNWQCQPANILGVNFCSNIFQVNGSYKILKTQEIKNFNFIIKDLLKEYAEIGTNEMLVYEQILPKMAKIVETSKIDKNGEKNKNKLAPSCFWTNASEAHEFYILEDLNALNFKLSNRLKGLEVKEAQMAIEKLAKFHAISMVYAEQQPAVIASLKPAQFASEGSDEMARLMFEKSMQCAFELFEKLNMPLVQKMQKLNKKFHAKIKEVVNPANSVFNVLNHGDFWLNNILFNSELEEAIFLDFQHVFWGGPSFDLNLFLYTSLPLQTLQTHRFRLLQRYYETLKAMLESLSYEKIPTCADFQKEIQRGALVAYYAAIIEWPTCCMNDEAAKGFTVAAFKNDAAAVRNIYKTQAACEFVWHAVLHFEEIGLFD